MLNEDKHPARCRGGPSLAWRDIFLGGTWAPLLGFSTWDPLERITQITAVVRLLA
jgi:hypothetical protein